MQQYWRIYNKVSGILLDSTRCEHHPLIISSMEEMMVYRQSLVQVLSHSSSQGYEVAPLAENVFPWRNQVELSILPKQKMPPTGVLDNPPPGTSDADK